jgi:hypothetical protein
MKQHITRDQLNELNEEQKKKLKNWWHPEYGDFTDYDDEEEQEGVSILPLLSIGQMIEFLHCREDHYVHTVQSWSSMTWEIEIEVFDIKTKYRHFVLCDALWMAVKGTL